MLSMSSTMKVMTHSVARMGSHTSTPATRYRRRLHARLGLFMGAKERDAPSGMPCRRCDPPPALAARLFLRFGFHGGLGARLRGGSRRARRARLARAAAR